jgi:hypothetical protein
MVPKFHTGTFFNVTLLKGYDTKKKPIEDDSIDIKEQYSRNNQNDAAKIPESNKARQATGSNNSHR